MYIKREIGKYGEMIATRYLQKQNYKIIEKNFYCKQGEIDIISKKDEYIVFIEVKTRTNYAFGSPSEAVDNLKQKHIYKSARYYLYKTKQLEAFVRFDVIEVYISKNKIYVHHIKQII